MLKIQNLSASYNKDGNVIEDINFIAHEGSINAIIGKNASGKSSLVKCISSSLDYSGNIFLDDKNIKEFTSLQRARKIAVLPQNLPSVALSVSEVAEMGRSPYTPLSGTLSETDGKIVKNALITAGVYDIRNKKISEISGGERQRAYLAMILSQDTDVIVLDEVTSHMDINHESEIMKLLMRLAYEQGKTVIITMHNISLIFKYADYVTVLEGGRQVFSDTSEECLKTDIIERTFNVKRKITTDNDIFFIAD